MYTDLTFTSRNKIENLQRKKESLQRRLEEKKLIRQLDTEVRALQKELDETNIGNNFTREVIVKTGLTDLICVHILYGQVSLFNYDFFCLFYFNITLKRGEPYNPSVKTIDGS